MDVPPRAVEVPPRANDDPPLSPILAFVGDRPRLVGGKAVQVSPVLHGLLGFSKYQYMGF